MVKINETQVALRNGGKFETLDDYLNNKTIISDNVVYEFEFGEVRQSTISIPNQPLNIANGLNTKSGYGIMCSQTTELFSLHQSTIQNHKNEYLNRISIYDTNKNQVEIEGQLIYGLVQTIGQDCTVATNKNTYILLVNENNSVVSLKDITVRYSFNLCRSNRNTPDFEMQKDSKIQLISNPTIESNYCRINISDKIEATTLNFSEPTNFSIIAGYKFDLTKLKKVSYNGLPLSILDYSIIDETSVTFNFVLFKYDTLTFE